MHHMAYAEVSRGSQISYQSIITVVETATITSDRPRIAGEVPRGEKMLYSGTDQESCITEYAFVYEDELAVLGWAGGVLHDDVVRSSGRWDHRARRTPDRHAGSNLRVGHLWRGKWTALSGPLSDKWTAIRDPLSQTLFPRVWSLRTCSD